MVGRFGFLVGKLVGNCWKDCDADGKERFSMLEVEFLVCQDHFQRGGQFQLERSGCATGSSHGGILVEEEVSEVGKLQLKYSR